MSLYLFILGVGIGASLQVLVIAVQNAVDYSDLGAATSGATFFRSIGGSFGTAVFGAIFSGVLAGDIAAALHGVSLPSGITASTGASPAVLEHLPAAIRDGYIAGYHAIVAVRASGRPGGRRNSDRIGHSELHTFTPSREAEE